MKGDFVGFEDDLDPAVASSFGEAKQRHTDAKLSPKVRKKKAAARAKDKARLERRVNWEIPTEIKQRVKAIAAEHGVPESQVAALLIIGGLCRLETGEIDLDDYKTLSDSPRYDANLILDRLETPGNSKKYP